MTIRNTSTSFFHTLSTTSHFRVCLKALAITVSFVLVAFGQPANLAWFGPIVSVCGFSLFFLQTVNLDARQRFWHGFTFFFFVQTVQLWWFTSHPFYYIWAVYFLVAALFGLQFGLLTLFASRNTLSTLSGALACAGIWTLLEWSRVSWFSGFYFNVIGQYLVANTLSLQLASLLGTLGLSFWVMLTNCLVTYSILNRFRTKACSLVLVAIALPYLFGWMHLAHLNEQQESYDEVHPPLSTVIVHSKKVPDEMQADLQQTSSPLERAFDRWKEAIYALGPFRGQTYDFILLPEVVVPFSSTSLIYPKELVNAVFLDALKTPFVTSEESYVCSEDIARGLTGAFGCPVIVGLESTQAAQAGQAQKFFNSAFCFTGQNYPHLRYDKQILVPMGEYTPFTWAKSIAMQYGIMDSFTPGHTSKVFCIGRHRVSPSICYEETFFNLMRQNSLLGATVLVNLTDDYWFPYSQLGLQHFEHARARTVENGTPLIRACNFGISGALDSAGRTVEAREGLPVLSAFGVTVSSFHYKTLYSVLGNWPILMISCAACILFLALKRKKAL